MAAAVSETTVVAGAAVAASETAVRAAVVIAETPVVIGAVIAASETAVRATVAIAETAIVLWSVVVISEVSVVISEASVLRAACITETTVWVHLRSVLAVHVAERSSSAVITTVESVSHTYSLIS